MSTILTVSSDHNAIPRIEVLAKQLKFRSEVLRTIKEAETNLSQIKPDIVLVDGDFDDEVVLAFLLKVWQNNSEIVGGIFNFYAPVAYEWSARLMGARVFVGALAFVELKAAMEGVSRKGSKTRVEGLMLVEDLDAARQIIGAYVSALGYPGIQLAPSVRDALQGLRANPSSFFAIITDLNMPNEDGKSLIDQVRADQNLKHLPITVLTANPTLENLVDCVRKGATGFLVKPPRKRELQFELEKARRIIINEQPPRLCGPDEAHLLETALSRIASL